jgi:hypothetical protein
MMADDELAAAAQEMLTAMTSAADHAREAIAAIGLLGGQGEPAEND